MTATEGKVTVAGTKAGDRIRADDGFTCIEPGAVLMVHEDDGLLFVFCQDEDGEPQRHYLDGQIECGCYVGFTKELTARQALSPSGRVGPMGETIKLNGRQRSELFALSQSPGLWRGCGPGKRDTDLEFYIAANLVVWLGTGRGYAITEDGRDAIARRLIP